MLLERYAGHGIVPSDKWLMLAHRIAAAPRNAQNAIPLLTRHVPSMTGKAPNSDQTMTSAEVKTPQNDSAL